MIDTDCTAPAAPRRDAATTGSTGSIGPATPPPEEGSTASHHRGSTRKNLVVREPVRPGAAAVAESSTETSTETSGPARVAVRVTRRRVVGVVAGAAVLAVVAVLVLTSGELPQGGAGAQILRTGAGLVGAPLVHDDGRVPPGGVSPFDGSSAAVAGLEAPLRAALQTAARAAEDDGVDVVVTSGWRSADAQRALFEEAVAERGSVEEARRFVLPPELSSHVQGQAVDVGPTQAAYWFAEHGAEYGLCQIYANEVWHYELAIAPGSDCPEQLPDATSVLP